MAARDAIGSPQYRLAWTAAAGHMRRVPQPGTGWSYVFAEREAQAIFNRMWCVPDYAVHNCIEAAVGSICADVDRTLAHTAAQKAKGAENG